VDLVNIGEFARASRLSPKALRLYDRSGLLSPAEVDATTGYRWYSTAQLAQAHLIAVLRRLGVPLAQIEEILRLDDAARAEQISAWWTDVEQEHAARRELAGLLVNRLAGRKNVMSTENEAALRELPARKVLSMIRHVGKDELLPVGKEFIGRFRAAKIRPTEGAAGAFFIIYYGEVGPDGDGPVEWCWPVPDDEAEQLAARFPDLTLRTDPAHEEAFVYQGMAAQVGEARAQLAIESLLAWATEAHRQPSGGIRQVFQSNPANGGAGPDCDFAIPLR
jgi:DNA-binding transcriptional MerR regulator